MSAAEVPSFSSFLWEEWGRSWRGLVILSALCYIFTWTVNSFFFYTNPSKTPPSPCPLFISAHHRLALLALDCILVLFLFTMPVVASGKFVEYHCDASGLLLLYRDCAQQMTLTPVQTACCRELKDRLWCLFIQILTHFSFSLIYSLVLCFGVGFFLLAVVVFCLLVWVEWWCWLLLFFAVCLSPGFLSR